MTATDELTREAILAQPASNRLDAWVAREVFGENVYRDSMHKLWRLGTDRRTGGGYPPPYSSDLVAAHAVIARMGQWFFEAEWGFTDGLCAGHWKPVHKTWTAAGWTVSFGPYEVTAAEFPLAVSRAALLAVVDWRTKEGATIGARTAVK